MNSCRELDLYNFNETVKVKGIELLRFEVPPFELYNASLNPANAAYFGDSIPSGVLNISNCNMKIPVRDRPLRVCAAVGLQCVTPLLAHSCL